MGIGRPATHERLVDAGLADGVVNMRERLGIGDGAAAVLCGGHCRALPRRATCPHCGKPPVDHRREPADAGKTSGG